MRAGIAVSLAIVGVLAAACTSVNTTAGGGGANAAQVGQPGYAGPGQGQTPAVAYATPSTPASQQPACDNPAGTYRVTRKRDVAHAGSCPPSDDNFDPELPIRVTWDGTKASQYKIELGYSPTQAFNPQFTECLNNHDEPCGFAATCRTTSGDLDQVHFQIRGGALTGQIHRTKASGCTMKLDLQGGR